MRKVRLMEGCGESQLLNFPDKQITVTAEGVEVGISEADFLLKEYQGIVEEIPMPPEPEVEATVEGPAEETASAEAETDIPETERLGGSSGAVEAPEGA